MKIKLIIKYILPLIFFYFVSSPIGTNASCTPGFFGGMVDGMISFLAIIVKLFYKNIDVWRDVNNGTSYKFGYVIGVLLEIMFLLQLFFRKEK